MTTETLPRFTIELGYIPPEKVRGNARNSHWGQASGLKKKLRQSGYDHTREARSRTGLDLRQPVMKVRVTYHFHHYREIDSDNLAIGMKSFRDGMIDAGLVPDDSPSHFLDGSHTFSIAREDHTTVTVEALE